MRDMLNRMGDRLKRIQKGKPLKKTAETDAIFDHVKAVRAAMKHEPATLEISMDTKAKVNAHPERLWSWSYPPFLASCKRCPW